QEQVILISPCQRGRRNAERRTRNHLPAISLVIRQGRVHIRQYRRQRLAVGSDRKLTIGIHIICQRMEAVASNVQNADLLTVGVCPGIEEQKMPAVGQPSQIGIALVLTVEGDSAGLSDGPYLFRSPIQDLNDRGGGSSHFNPCDLVSPRRPDWGFSFVGGRIEQLVVTAVFICDVN